MEKLEKYITDERTGLTYELIGDYYFIAGDDKPDEERPIGIWGQRRLRYIKQYNRIFYTQLLISGKLNDHLADINEQAADMFFGLVKQMTESEDITEKLKAENQLEWVARMNNIQNRATEILNTELIWV